MAFAFPGGTLSPGQTIRLYLQFNNYQYAGPKLIQASPIIPFVFPLSTFVLTTDLGHERRIGSSANPFLYVYSIAITNISTHIAVLQIVGGDVQ
jgi:hypothetical protein